jgi:hypothetical protein
MSVSDQDLIDKINPFVSSKGISLPGTVGQVVDFGEYEAPTNEKGMDEYVSPMCGYGQTIEGRIGREEPCELSRPLLPGRNIDDGDFSEPSLTGESKKSTKSKKCAQCDCSEGNPCQCADCPHKNKLLTINHLLLSVVSLSLLIAWF